MKLNEIKPNTLSRIERFMNKNRLDLGTDFTIRADGKVDVNKNVIITNKSFIENGKFPFEFGIIDGLISAKDTGIKSLKGFPEKCDRSANLPNNPISSFDGLDGTQECDIYDFTACLFTDLHNIHKHISKTTSIDLSENKITEKILGICLIDGLMFLNGMPSGEHHDMVRKIDYVKGEFVNTNSGEVYTPLQVAFHIVGKHLGEGKPGLLDAQKELLDWDLDDFAEI